MSSATPPTGPATTTGAVTGTTTGTVSAAPRGNRFTGTFHKKKNEEDASYDEVFTYFNTETSPKNIKYREQKQRLTMPSLDSMIETIKSSGFRMQEKVHLISAGKEYQYLVYFTK